MDINSVLELSDLAKQDAENYPLHRSLLEVMREETGKHFSGISGPRGVGKTVLLRQLAAEDPEACYLSLDTLARDEDLFEIVKKLYQDYGYRRFLLDEIHFHPQVDEVLKKLYDFLDVRVCFTSSVALALTRSAWDLSRRAVIHPLYPFSYREYLFFKHGIQIPALELGQIVDKRWSPEHMRAGRHFEDYIRGGLMPFALQEPEPLPILERVLTTVIRKDIPTVARLHIDELDIIEKLVAFVGRAEVDGINYTSLARNLGITKYKAEQYLGLLETAFVLQRIFPRGTNVLKEPKVLMALPYRLLYRDFNDALGGMREDFFGENMRRCRQSVHYLKSTRGSKTPDYMIDDGPADNLVIEIGGRRNGRERFKNVSVGRKVIFAHGDETDAIRRPLFMLGYLET